MTKKSIVSINEPVNVSDTDIETPHDAKPACSFDSVLEKLQHNLEPTKSLINEIKLLKKNSNKKLKRKVDPNKPKPFSNPVEITNELRLFLNIEGNICRSDITKLMYKYVKDNALQNKEQKRQFFIDDKLSDLFGLNKGDSIDYFKLQTYMKPHYIKKT